MRRIGTVVLHFALAVWVGGGALYTFVLTPAIFAAYPRNTAGDVVGTMMPHYFVVQLAATAAAGLALLACRDFRPKGRRALVLALAAGALVAQCFVQWRLYPQILEVKARVASFEADPDSPERKRFRALHGASMALNLLVIADGAVLLGLAAVRREDRADKLLDYSG